MGKSGRIWWDHVVHNKGKKYRLTRNFYKEKKLESFSVKMMAALWMRNRKKGTILGNQVKAVYDNTVSVAQLKSVTGKNLVRELQNYMASYQGTGDSSIDMGRAMQMLKMSRKGYLTEAARRKKAGKGKRKDFRKHGIYPQRSVNWMRSVIGSCSSRTG